MTSKEAKGPDRGPSSSSRRNLLKGGLIAALGLAVVGLSGPVTGKTAQKLLGGSLFQKASGSSTRTLTSLSSLGDQMPVSEAMVKTSFPTSVPSSLPAGTTLAQSRVAADGNMLTLLYSNSSMQPLGLYKDGSVLAVFQIKESVLKGPPSFLPPSFERVSVNGNPGFGRGPSSDGGPGQLQWWSGGRRISILGNLSVPELMVIGSSMGETQ